LKGRKRFANVPAFQENNPINIIPHYVKIAIAIGGAPLCCWRSFSGAMQ